MNTAPELTVFTGLWPVESGYEVVQRRAGGETVRVVVPTDLSKPRFIEPGSFPRIASEFGEVESKDQLLAFNQKYGLLGYARLFPGGKKYGGDPLLWSLRHARQVAAAFEIIWHIKRGPSQVLAELPAVLRSIGWDFMGSTTEGQKWGRLFTPTGKTISVRNDDGNVESVHLHVITPGTMFEADWPSNPLRVAWRVLSYLINDQIRGLRIEVSEEKLRTVVAFNALLEVIYLQAAGELEGLHLRRCKVCGTVFRAKRSDAECCTAQCRVEKSRAKKRKQKKHRRKRGSLQKK